MKTDESKMLRFRIRILGSIMYALFFLMAGKAVYYQVFLSEWLADKAMSQYEKVDVFSGKRGNIYDASNRKMAVSIDVVSVGGASEKNQGCSRNDQGAYRKYFAC